MNKVGIKQEQMDKEAERWKFYERSKLNTGTAKQHTRKQQCLWKGYQQAAHSWGILSELEDI